MRINTNITALNTYNSYTAANNKIASSVAKLSSGYAINSAADNAAGLAISEKMRAQIRGLDKASSNSQTAISLAQTAEGSLESSGEILQRMREISVQSSSDTNQDNIDRDALQAEFSQLNSELDEIAQDSTFNNQHLLNGNLATKKANVSITTTASGLSSTVGKAQDGNYQFGVKVVTTADKVDGSAPTSLAVSNSTVNSYFSGIDANTTINSTDHSTLLNGNYKITDASVNVDDGKITVTAQGDNNQTFHATLDMANYEGPTTSPDSYKLDFGANAFSMTFNKSAGIGTSGPSGTGLTANSSQITDLANAFKGTEFTVSGGVADKAAEKAVYASMTGASDVKLQAGMSSVSFDNGVTVNFDKLTAADLDTTEKFTGTNLKLGTLDSAFTRTTVTTIDPTKEFASSSYTLTTKDNGDSTFTVTATGANGDTYTSKIDNSTPVTANTDISLAFKANSASASPDFTLKLNIGGAAITDAGGSPSGTADDVAGKVNGTTFTVVTDANSDLYDVTSVLGTPTYGTTDLDITTSGIASAAASSFVADPTVDASHQNGSYTLFSAIDDHTKTTITLKNANGDTYTGQITDTTGIVDGTGTAIAFTSTTNSSHFTLTLTAKTGTPITGDGNIAGPVTTLFGTGSIDIDATSTVDNDNDQYVNSNYNFENVFGKTTVEQTYSGLTLTGTSDTKESDSGVSVKSSSNRGLTIQVGANTGDEMEINIERADAEFLGVKGLDVSTQASASKAVDAVNKAINQVSSQRAYLGAVQNRLTYKIDNLTTSSQNLNSAESSIRDVDMASEMTKFTNSQILSQASTAMLAQANALPQNVLSLLK